MKWPVLGAMAIGLGVMVVQGGEAARMFRFALSETLVSKNVGTSDARQAMAAWESEIKRQVPNFVSFEVSVPSSADISRRFRSGEYDAVVVTAFEYPSIASLADSTLMINEATPEGEEYLLLVHQDSGIKSVSDLRGRKISIYDHPKMNVARVWLDTLLANSKMAPAENYFSTITTNPKLNLTVLSVFFKNMDACLVAKRSFATMTELNPQLSVKLQVLAASPKLVSSVLVFRKDTPAQSRRDFESALNSLKGAPAGQQALALFDGTGIVKTNASIMKASLELIAAHERLRQKAGSGGK